MTPAREGAVGAMTLTEVSEALNLDRRVIVDMLTDGVLRGNRTRGGVWRIDSASVAAWLRGEVASVPGNRAVGGKSR